LLPNPSDLEGAYALAPSDPAAWVRALDLRMTINGEDAPSAVTASVIDPCREEAIATYPESGLEHLEAAVAAAAAAFPSWAARSWAERRAAVEHFADLMEAARMDFAVILACESGRPLRWCLREMLGAVSYARILAALDLPARDLSVAGLRAEIKRKALGVVGAIAPWNAPVILAVAKIANAL